MTNHLPLSNQYTPVSHSIAIGPDNSVYVLVTKPNGAEIQKLSFFQELTPILIAPLESSGFEDSLVTVNLSECLSRQEMLDVASNYLHNTTYIDSYHINDPNNYCTSRTKPPYLINAGTYPSVPYAWGMADTVKQFNDFMGGGYNNLFAGDYTDPNSGCGRGVDCSGFVSNVWNLGSHYGTCELETISKDIGSFSLLRPGDIVNRCATTPRHVIMYVMFGNDGIGNGMWGYEATIEFQEYKVAWTFRRFSDISSYVPMRYNDVCEKTFLPMVNMHIQTLQNTIGTGSSDTLTNPYPPPGPKATPNPYP